MGKQSLISNTMFFPSSSSGEGKRGEKSDEAERALSIQNFDGDEFHGSTCILALLPGQSYIL